MIKCSRCLYPLLLCGISCIGYKYKDSHEHKCSGCKKIIPITFTKVADSNHKIIMEEEMKEVEATEEVVDTEDEEEA